MQRKTPAVLQCWSGAHGEHYYYFLAAWNIRELFILARCHIFGRGKLFVSSWTSRMQSVLWNGTRWHFCWFGRTLRKMQNKRTARELVCACGLVWWLQPLHARCNILSVFPFSTTQVHYTRDPWVAASYTFQRLCSKVKQIGDHSS